MIKNKREKALGLNYRFYSKAIITIGKKVKGGNYEDV